MENPKQIQLTTTMNKDLFTNYVFLNESGGVIAMTNQAYKNLVSQGDSTEYVNGKAVRTRTFVFQYIDDNDDNIVIETR